MGAGDRMGAQFQRLKRGDRRVGSGADFEVARHGRRRWALLIRRGAMVPWLMTRSKRLMAAYSILSSARSNNDSGIVNPNAFAVLSLSASSNLLAAQNACLCVAHATTHQNASSVRHGQLPAAGERS